MVTRVFGWPGIFDNDTAPLPNMQISRHPSDIHEAGFPNFPCRNASLSAAYFQRPWYNCLRCRVQSGTYDPPSSPSNLFEGLPSWATIQASEHRLNPVWTSSSYFRILAPLARCMLPRYKAPFSRRIAAGSRSRTCARYEWTAELEQRNKPPSSDSKLADDEYHWEWCEQFVFDRGSCEYLGSKPIFRIKIPNERLSRQKDAFCWKFGRTLRERENSCDQEYNEKISRDSGIKRRNYSCECVHCPACS